MTVDAKEFILAQVSTEQRAFAEAKVDFNKLTRKGAINRGNLCEYCEDITTAIVYEFASQVEDEGLWNLIFTSLLDYAYRKYFPNTGYQRAHAAAG